MKFQVPVYMLAFGRQNEVRDVELPLVDKELENEHLLDKIFVMGQNENQPQPHPSVSVGDVIELYGTYWLVKSVGFEQLDAKEFERYILMDQRNERWFRAHSD
jgi:hypothetical protein